MLDTAFPRILGDAGNPASYHRPARIMIVPNAGSPDIVRDGAPHGILIAAFCNAAQRLEREGAIAITSTCGFLVAVQDQIAASVNIPVMVSALSLFPLVRQAHGNQPIGIITASKPHLGRTAMQAVGAAPDQVRIIGMEDCDAFASMILAPKSVQPDRIDAPTIKAATVAKAKALCAQDTQLGAIILECGNLPPYADAVADATGKRVYSLLDAARLIAP